MREEMRAEMSATWCKNNVDNISWNKIFFAILQTHIII